MLVLSRYKGDLIWYIKKKHMLLHHEHFFLFIGLEFIVPLEHFSLMWRRHHCWWRAANFDLCSALMAIELWGFFTCHTYCDTGLPLIMVISEDPWNSPCCRAFGSGAVITCFYDLHLSRPGIEPRSPDKHFNTVEIFDTLLRIY